jgi:hypothetical protein
MYVTLLNQLRESITELDEKPEIKYPEWLLERIKERQVTKRKIQTLCESVIELYLHGSTSKTSGRQVYDHIMNCLSVFRVVPGSVRGRSDNQIKVHQAGVFANLPFIYGNEWEYNQSAVLKSLGLTTLNQLLLVSTPRRFGKTTAVAMLVAALVYCIPNRYEVLIFAQNLRTSRAMMEKIQGFMCQLPEGEKRIVKCTTSGPACELLFLHQGKNAKVQPSKITALPTGGDNLRGTGGDFLIVEEMSFVSAATMTVNIAPPLKKRNTVFMGISSPSPDKTDLFNTLIEEKDDKGNYHFHTILIQLRCKECIDKNARYCEHLQKETPAWLNSKRDEVIKLFYKNDPQLFRSEIMGISSSLYRTCLWYERLNHCFNTNRRQITEFVSVIFVFFDPSGGGKASNTGVTSLLYTQDNYLVVIFHNNNQSSIQKQVLRDVQGYVPTRKLHKTSLEVIEHRRINREDRDERQSCN